ncbi:MAG: phenylalanine--tRNA ligase subunit alpha [Thaumarchaeota archaeon]|nr:phenylalanine--tRNA ligase subunit alpha [Nitrososphaerota archaeon]
MSTSLHPMERKVLAALAGVGSIDFDHLVEKSGLNEDQVRRSLQWLSSKGLVKIDEKVESALRVGRSPPELELLRMIEGSSEPPTIKALKGSFASEGEFAAAFGRAKKLGWIALDGEGQDSAVRLGDPAGPKPLKSLLESISKGSGGATLAPEQKSLIPELVQRGVILRSESQKVSVMITDPGKAAAASTVSEQYLDRLTPEALSSGSWRGKNLRPIDVEAKAPRLFPGRRHPVRDFIREVKETYVSMGFTELEGNSVHPAFWNFDALFIPQDHPGRDMQDTFYLEGLSDKKLSRKGVIANVAATHESGWKTGSRGWGYSWNIEEARRLVLRTHNTVLTVKALSESGEKETRVFAVSKVYRNENLDYKHLAEFHQMDGIMVGEGLNVRHLMGFLTEFYKKLGMKAVKLWPSYFPYTEPSLEVVGYSDAVKAWIELSGSGVFRPEVTIPLGVKVPVLAWGPGIERLMLMRFGLDDMRELYGNDLSWLRNRVEIASR